MTRAVQAVLADVLRLDPRPRTELASELPESTEGPCRRVTAIEAGTENFEPWEKVRRRMERKTRYR